MEKSDLEKKLVIVERKFNDRGSSMEMKFKSEMRKQQEHFQSQISKYEIQIQSSGGNEYKLKEYE